MLRALAAVEHRAEGPVAFKTPPTLLVRLPGTFGLLDDESVQALAITKGEADDVIAQGIEHGERWRIQAGPAADKYPDLPA